MLLSSSFNTEDLDWKVISSRVEVFGMWKEREKKQKTIDSFFLYLFIFLFLFFGGDGEINLRRRRRDFLRGILYFSFPFYFY